MSKRIVGWTHVRIKTATRARLDRVKALLTEAYVEGRSPAPLRNPDHGATDDEVIDRALDYLLSERKRKNRPKRQRPRARRIAPAVVNNIPQTAPIGETACK